MEPAFTFEEDQPPSAEEQRIARLQAFADSLVEKRKAAVDARARSGIETEWQEDEDFYNGIDSPVSEGWQKGVTMDAPLTKAKSEAPGARSTIFVNITQTYVDMAASAIADMLLPTDDMPFGVLPEPEPDLFDVVKNPGQTFTAPDGTEQPADQVAQQMLDESAESAKKAETKIWDWLTGSGWHGEVRKLIHQAARIGTSVLKGPFPATVRSKKMDQDKNGNVVVTMVDRIEPRSKQINPNNLFPDPACGENIHRGAWIWEQDRITAKEIKDLKDLRDEDGHPYYIGSQIDLVLREGPDKKYGNDGELAPDAAEADAEKFTVWYFTGLASAEDMNAAGCACKDGATVPCVVTVVNDRVVKAALTTLDSGSFPYDVFVWQPVPGRWAGTGEGRKVRTPQKMLNGATRRMMDNAGLCSGPQLIIDQDVIEPADGSWKITPLKLWRKKQGVELPGGKLENAIVDIEISSRQEQLMNIVKYALEMADRVATMPIQQQGQQGITQETAEGRRILQNNASVAKRFLAKMFDDWITEPHIGRYYEYLLMYGNDPTMKRDLVIDARGSTALYERDAQNIAVAQLAPLLDDPEYGISKSKWIVEHFKSNKLDPKRFRMTDEEIAEAKKQPPPKPPQVQVAEINASTKIKAATMDRDRDTEHFRIQDQMRNDNDAYNMERLRVQERLAILSYAERHNTTLEQVKGDLAKTVLELRSQERMAQLDSQGKLAPAPQVADSPAEPPGRAPRGRAFQR